MQPNDLKQPATDSDCLLEIIELKWLLAAHGLRLHVEQLQHDPEYARLTLDRACSAGQPSLCAAATRLRGHLGLNPPSEAATPA